MIKIQCFSECAVMVVCLSPFRLLYQNITDKVTYKQKCISYNSRGWQVQDQGTSMAIFSGEHLHPGS